MSFEEKFSHYEDASYHSPVNGEITKGELVGGDTPQKHNSDLTSDLDEKKSKKEEPHTFAALSIDEMQKVIDTGKKELKKVAGMNPDWPPAKGNPEDESRLAGDLEGSLNQVT